MPRMLYYRGLAFRKLGKPGFAVSDLTSALWLKGGLSEAERADAIKVRALAYNEAGISDVPPVPQSSYAEAPTLPGQSTDRADANGDGRAPPAPPLRRSGRAGTRHRRARAASADSSRASVRRRIIELERDAGRGADDHRSIDRRRRDPSCAAWGGTTEVAPADAPPPQRAPEIASPFVTQVAAVDQPKTSANGRRPRSPARRRRASTGCRSPPCARARKPRRWPACVVGRHAEQLGGRKPEVDETVIGSMGTFYRVRLGPYASADEPEHLCVALRSDGFDCLVVSP